MTRVISLLALSVFVAGCKPTYKDYDREVTVAFQGFMTGDVHTAKAALLTQENILATHESRGNRSIDYRGARVVLYGNLFGLCDFVGETNEAEVYLQKYNENLDHKLVTYEELASRAEQHHNRLQPKWREPR